MMLFGDNTNNKVITIPRGNCRAGQWWMWGTITMVYVNVGEMVPAGHGTLCQGRETTYYFLQVLGCKPARTKKDRKIEEL